MSMIIRYIIFLLFINFSITFSEEAIDRAVLVTTKLDTIETPKIIVNWIPDTNAVEYVIKRKKIDSSSWIEFIKLNSKAVFFIDSTIEKGITYEYFIKKKSTFYSDTAKEIYNGYSYISAGWDIEVKDNLGRLLLLVDNTMAEPLKKELEQFELDIIGDGWQLVRINVPRTEEFEPEAVLKIKDIILNEYYSSSDSLDALILFGRIAVPYSGDIAPDGHIQHKGAWVADVFYADIDGKWTDIEVYDTVAISTINWNIPGDGKFDQSQIPSDIDLQTGRIDFYNITYFKIPEIELLRNYLNKAHRYKHKIFVPKYEAVVDDNFGIYGEAFASCGWLNFASLLSADSVDAGDFVRPLDSASAIWAYGTGSGSQTGIKNTVSLEYIDTLNVSGVFTMLFGSYNGDWDRRNNVLRGTLAYTPQMLTCSWSGRPFWHYHHMGLDKNIGYSTKLSQNNQYLYESSGLYGYRFTHVSLLGDPTLRMYVEETPYNILLSSEISYDSSKVNLSWKVSPDNLLGCEIYRASGKYDKFIKINNELIKTNSYIDRSPLPGRNLYMIRAKRYRNTASGSILNLSQGVFASLDIPHLSYSSQLNYSLKSYPNPADSRAKISVIIPKEEEVNISIYDINGKLIKEIVNKILYPRLYVFNWNLKNDSGNKVPSGTYLVKLSTQNKTFLLNLRVIH